MPGRGGAGNIEAANQAASQLLQQSQSRAEDQVASPSPLEQAQQTEYAHTGRGGAGNYYSPRHLAETGAFGAAPGPDDSQPKGSSSGSGRDQTAAAPMSGRGGAGNFMVDEATLGGSDSFLVSDAAAAAQRRAEQDLEKGLLPRAPSAAHVRSRPGEPVFNEKGEAEALDAAAR